MTPVNGMLEVIFVDVFDLDAVHIWIKVPWVWPGSLGSLFVGYIERKKKRVLFAIMDEYFVFLLKSWWLWDWTFGCVGIINELKSTAWYNHQETWIVIVLLYVHANNNCCLDLLYSLFLLSLTLDWLATDCSRWMCGESA